MIRGASPPRGVTCAVQFHYVQAERPRKPRLRVGTPRVAKKTLGRVLAADRETLVECTPTRCPLGARNESGTLLNLASTVYINGMYTSIVCASRSHPLARIRRAHGTSPLT